MTFFSCLCPCLRESENTIVPVRELERMTVSEEVKSPIEERVSVVTKEVFVVDEEEEGDSSLDVASNDYPIAILHTMPDSTLVEWNRLKQPCAVGRSVVAYRCETLKDKVGKKGASEYLKGEIAYRSQNEQRPGFLEDYQAITTFKKCLTDRESAAFLTDYIPVITRPAWNKATRHKNLVYQEHPICEYRDLHEDVGGLSKEEQVKIVEELFGKLARYFELNLHPVGIKKLYYRREGSTIESFFTQESLEPFSGDPESKKETYSELGELLGRYFIVLTEPPVTIQSLEDARCPKEASKLIMQAVNHERLNLSQIPENITHMPLTEFVGIVAPFYEEKFNFYINRKTPGLAPNLLLGLHVLLKKGYVLCDMQKTNVLWRGNGDDVVLNDFEGLVDFELMKKNATCQGLVSFIYEFKGWNIKILPGYVQQEHDLLFRNMANLYHKGFDSKDLDALHKDLNRFQILVMGCTINDLTTTSEPPLSTLIQRMIDPDPLERPTVDELIL